MSVLSAKEVVYEYRNTHQTVRAVNGVSCGFEQGKVYAIVGSSGSGKTTFLSLLAGLDVPTSGTIELDGIATADMDRDDYRLNHVSVIYQNFNLFQHLTVLENAAYPLYVHKMAGKEADVLAREKLLQVGLTEDQLKRLPNMLSGGEQQRKEIVALVDHRRVIPAVEVAVQVGGGTALKEDLAIGGQLQSSQQGKQRGLAGAGLAHDGIGAALHEGAAHVFDCLNGLGFVLIGKADIFSTKNTHNFTPVLSKWRWVGHGRNG